MGLVVGIQTLLSRIEPFDVTMRSARVCYKHLAGDKGIQLYDSLLLQGCLEQADGGLVLTTTGDTFCSDFGIDLNMLRAGKAVLCRECLDWSERRSQLAGSLGRAYLSRFEEFRWVSRVEDSRAVNFTRKGDAEFTRLFITA